MRYIWILTVWLLMIMPLLGGCSTTQSGERNKLTKLTHQFEDQQPTPSRLFKNVNAWIYNALELKTPSSSDSKVILNEMAGICGHYDIVLRDFAQSLNYPSRSIGLLYIPNNLGHAATEVFYDKDWHFFDSTYGIFYTDINSEEILSIHKVRTQFPNIKVFKVIGQKPSRGRWLSGTNFSYKEVPLSRFKQEIGIAVEDYILSELSVQDRNRIFEDGLYIDLNNQTHGQIGELNNSASELYGNKTVMDYGEAYVPYLPFLGRYYDKQIVVKRIAFVTDRDRTVNFESVRLKDR